ncbi:thiolase family protein [Bacillus sp. B15-48]|uniref:thiolase family protein n=1 Tax=Bacillus sp. B15-48 TaxID=1548601 RepID=UPI00194007E6|nr:thiolase family protein [Bacillus sp. B15-48]MBM4763785.1 thiolase family protein [Bacillus sp. B15-48]
MQDVYILGIGMNRFGKYPEETVRTMAEDVINQALKDAGIGKEDIEAGFFSNSFWGMFDNQHSIRGQVIFRGMGIDRIPVTNVENACAGGSTALHLAYTGIRAGMYDVAIAVGSEKITNPDKAKSLSSYSSCMDVENYEQQIQTLLEYGKNLQVKLPADESKPGSGRSVFMDVYAMMTRWHMRKYGTTQRQLATIAAKNHFHSSLNPKAQYQTAMNVEEVLADSPVTYPLTRSMCAPVGDGAAAIVVCSESFLKKIGGSRAVKILASVHGQGSNRDLDGEDIGERLAKAAYEMSGLGPDDIDFAELHDATAYGELHQCEAMGFCPPGEGGKYAESGATTLGGEKPINTSGGLESRGHPIGASGLAQLYEVVTQLRGEAGNRQVIGAKIGLAENGGGSIGVEEAAMCIHIIGKA